jgi:hypothetical protein
MGGRQLLLSWRHLVVTPVGKYYQYVHVFVRSTYGPLWVCLTNKTLFIIVVVVVYMGCSVEWLGST